MAGDIEPPRPDSGLVRIFLSVSGIAVAAFSWFAVVGCSSSSGGDAGAEMRDVVDGGSADTGETPQPAPPTSYGDMTTIPAGPFVQGCLPPSPSWCFPPHNPNADFCCTEFSRPAHMVTTSAYAIDVVEVTVEAYSDCVAAGACTPARSEAQSECNFGRSGRDKHPINCLRAEQGDAFCA